jgi:hypothetical protein
MALVQGVKLWASSINLKGLTNQPTPPIVRTTSATPVRPITRKRAPDCDSCEDACNSLDRVRQTCLREILTSIVLHAVVALIPG